MPYLCDETSLWQRRSRRKPFIKRWQNRIFWMESVRYLFGCDGSPETPTYPCSCGIDHRGSKVYQITYQIRFDGKDQRFLVDISANGICGLGGASGSIKDPLAQFCIWSEWLWQDYRGCYWDFDLQQYVYYDKEG